MNARDPQDVIDAVTGITLTFGTQVTITRFTESATPSRSVFGSDLNGTSSTTTAQVTIEDIRKDMLPTIAGQRPKEIVLLLAPSGTFKNGDTVAFSGNNYLVNEIFPIDYVGQEVAEEVQMSREVD